MVSKKRKSPEERFVYFYLNGNLHKTLKRKRSEDLLIAWDYPNEKRVAYVLSHVQKSRQRAYSVPQVAKFMSRDPETIKRHMNNGEIKKPQYSYSLENRTRPIKYFFSEDEVREIHEFFKTIHRGRPRIDGEVTTSKIPSSAELEAMMRNEKILYVKNDSGDFVPVWKQPEW